MSFGEILALHQELEALETENMERSTGTRDDLLMAATLLEVRARRLDVAHLIGATMLRRASILNASRRWAEAVSVLEDARGVLPTSGYDHLAVSAWCKLAEAHAGLQDWRAVSAASAAGIALVERNRHKVSAPYMQSSYLRFSADLYRLGVRAAFEVGDVGLLLQRAERAKARGALRSQLAHATDAPRDEALDRRLHEVSERLEALGEDATADELAALRAERRRLWDLLAIGRLRHVTDDALPEFALGDVQARLAQDEAIIYYFWVDATMLVVVTLNADHVAVEQRSLSDVQVRQLGEETGLVMGLSAHDVLNDRFFHEWSWLLPNVEWLTPAHRRVRRLLISPHQVLHALPFHALRWNDRYLIEHFAVTFIPNLSSLLLAYRTRGDRRVLSIGIGRYDLPGRRVQPLPRAEAEARAVAALYWAAGVHSTGLYHEAASAARLRRWATDGVLSRYSIVHLAGHAENVPGDTPLESQVYVHDAVLDGLEIAGWHLPAELVVVSACSAGQRAIGGRGLPDVPGDELFGLQAALFAAGARRIISPLWPVADDVGLSLMQALHRHLVTGCPPEVAHQRAVKGFIADARLTRRRPHYWAPFYVTAMGRPSESHNDAGHNGGDQRDG